jgi:pyrroloquinoline-quinone synthase
MPVPVIPFLDRIDALVAEKSLLRHPFYQAWTRGELTAEVLREYATQYYHHVEAFPTYLSALHSHTAEAATRRHILANLNDEEAGSPNHLELWLQFARAVGAAEADVKNAPAWPETAQLVAKFRHICQERSTAEGVAALYAYESQIPSVAESKIDGLKRFYGIEQPEALQYFRVHIEADREHSAVERKLLEAYVNNDRQGVIEDSVREVLDSLNDMLSGVCRRHAINC